MRGEDVCTNIIPPGTLGSPPHARGRLQSDAPYFVGWGITPACAGKTQRVNTLPHSQKDHPRMRGEDEKGAPHYRRGEGSPPHARGRPIQSANLAYNNKDHPRMRGEDINFLDHLARKRGSPPHARGRRLQHCFSGQRKGITPACAGKTRAGRFPVIHTRDHPRMRGEDAV